MPAASTPRTWNTLHIHDLVEGLRQRGEVIDNETLSHISLLPYKHVLPNGTYFIADDPLEGDFMRKVAVLKEKFGLETVTFRTNAPAGPSYCDKRQIHIGGLEISHSYLRLFTGLAVAALIDW